MTSAEFDMVPNMLDNAEFSTAVSFSRDSRREKVQDDRSYYYHRAAAEVSMAQKATGPQAVRAHYDLASHYLDQAYGGGSGRPASSEEVRAHLKTDLFLSR